MDEDNSKGMKRHFPVDLDKLLEDYSQIEKKFADVNGRNNLLEIQLEKLSRMWKISQTKEQSLAQECSALQTMIKGLQDTLELQCNMKDENSSLRRTINTLEEKLQAAMQFCITFEEETLRRNLKFQECKKTMCSHSRYYLNQNVVVLCQHKYIQEHQKKIDLMMSDMRTKEEALKAKLQKMHCEMEAKLLLKEEEKNKQLSKMEMELCELTQRLQTQEKEKQSELIKQQIEFSAKLARIENRNTKSHSETSTLSQNIYRMKLQHLQEEKNREIEGLRNTIKNLEKRLGGDSDSRLKRRRF